MPEFTVPNSIPVTLAEYPNPKELISPTLISLPSINAELAPVDEMNNQPLYP
jgi:hypothetical protein